MTDTLKDRQERIDDLRLHDWRRDLRDGQWVKFRDPVTIPDGERESFKKVGVMVGLLGERINDAVMAGHSAIVEMMLNRQADLVTTIEKSCIALFVTEWSFPQPVPRPNDLSSLAQLPGVVVDEIYATAKDLLDAAFLNTEVTPPSVDSPFPASNGSTSH